MKASVSSLLLIPQQQPTIQISNLQCTSKSQLSKQEKNTQSKFSKNNELTTNIVYTTEYFSESQENQRKFMKELQTILQLNTEEEWLSLPKRKLLQFTGAKELLQLYNNNYREMLSAVYPHSKYYYKYFYTYSKDHFKTKENQREFMNKLYKRLHLKQLDDWLNVSKNIINLNGGRNLLLTYQNSLPSLLTSIYPTHDWKFEFLKSQVSYEHLSESKENQKNVIVRIYQKLNLNNMEQLKELSRKTWIRNNAKYLLLIYQNNKLEMLKSIFPNYPWMLKTQTLHQNIANINSNKNSNNGGGDNNDKDVIIITSLKKKIKSKITRKEYFEKIENQREFMERLFNICGYTNLKDFTKLSRNRVIINKGEELLVRYHNDLYLLLTSIYPNYNWNHLFHTSILSISKQPIPIHDNNNHHLLHQNEEVNRHDIYMKHDNDSDSMELKITGSVYQFFQSQSNRREFMEKLFLCLKLSTLSDWISVSKATIKKYGGKRLLSFYAFDNKLYLLRSIYPNYPWGSTDNQINRFLHSSSSSSPSTPPSSSTVTLMETAEYLKQHPISQTIIMDQLFTKLKLSSLNDWLEISKSRFRKLTLQSKLLLDEIYHGDYHHLLTTIYPFHDWKDAKSKLLIRKQRAIMQNISSKLNLRSLDDWANVTRTQIERYGGKRVLAFYSFSLPVLLRTLYPDHTFHFPHEQHKLNTHIPPISSPSSQPSLSIRESSSLRMNYFKGAPKLKYKPTAKYYNSRTYLQRSLLSLQSFYQIRKQKDWYRLTMLSDQRHLNLFEALQIIHPDQLWDVRSFQLRSKKSSQRLLYVFSTHLFYPYLLLENYRSPIFSYSFEFDLYLPSLNLALEYHGAHHFNDIPSGFNQLEMYQERDNAKLQIAPKHSISLVVIPFWWDNSFDSLISTIHSVWKLPTLQ